MGLLIYHLTLARFSWRRAQEPPGSHSQFHIPLRRIVVTVHFSKPTKRSMYPIFLTLSALLSLAAVHATDQLSCTFDCPTEDLASFPLGDHMYSDDGASLFCSYPAFPGGGAGDFSCTYDSTGALSQDGDAGFCPKAAIASCQEADYNIPPQSSATPTTTPVTHVPDEL